MSRSSIVVAVAIFAWLVLLAAPMLAYYLGWLVFVAFLTLVGWAAFRSATSGGRSGMLFVLVLAFLPLWVMGGYGLYCLLMGIDASYEPQRR